MSCWETQGKGGLQWAGRANNTCRRLSDSPCSTFGHSSLLQTYTCESETRGMSLGIQRSLTLQVSWQAVVHTNYAGLEKHLRHYESLRVELHDLVLAEFRVYACRQKM